MRRIERPSENDSGGLFIFGPSGGRYQPGHLPGVVAGVCRRDALLQPGDRVLAACSGGIDSRVLLDVLVRIKDTLDVFLGVAHFNHKLRGEESERDEDFVRRLAEAYGIPFHSGAARGRRKTRESLQMWARDRRSRFLERTAAEGGYTCIATAHTLNDQAETILMNLLQGYPGRSAHGIARRRGMYIRPLLGVSRETIVAYAGKHNLQHVEDSSNSGDKYLRNRVRHHLLPGIEHAFDPHIVAHLSAWGDYFHLLETWLTEQVETAWSECVYSEDSGQIILELGAFNRYFIIIRNRLIHKALKKIPGGADLISERLIEDVVRGAEAKRTGRTFQPGGLLRIAIERGCIRLYRQRDESFQFHIHPGQRHRFLRGQLNFVSRFVQDRQFAEDWQETLRIDHLEGPLVLRTWQTGDRFQPFGMQQPVRLSEYFSNRHISRVLRGKTPLLVKGGTIIWVCGVGIAEQVRVTAPNQRCLAVRCTFSSQ